MSSLKPISTNQTLSQSGAFEPPLKAQGPTLNELDYHTATGHMRWSTPVCVTIQATAPGFLDLLFPLVVVSIIAQELKSSAYREYGIASWSST